MEKQVKYTDLKHGVTLFSATIVPMVNEDGSIKFMTQLSEWFIRGRAHRPKTPNWHRPWQALGDETMYSSWQGGYITHSTFFGMPSMLMLDDRNVNRPGRVRAPYNLHRVFKTRKQRDAYVRRIEAECLTVEERETLNGLLQRQDRWREQVAQRDPRFTITGRVRPVVDFNVASMFPITVKRKHAVVQINDI